MSSNHLLLGQWNVLCDLCGRKFKSTEVQKDWRGLIVCKEDYELRHPADFLRVQREKITVPFSRPYPTQDTFIAYSCSIRELNGKADVGSADCARVEMTLPYEDFGSETLWIYSDTAPAVSDLGLGGVSTAGIILSLEPEN